MSEADVHIPRDFNYLGEARVNAHPGPELSDALQRFINPARVRDLGGKVLELRSERSVAIYRAFDDTEYEEPTDAVSKADLVAMSMRLEARQRTVRPSLSPEVGLIRVPAPKDMADEGEGMDLRFKVRLDQLTKQVLRHTVLLSPQDGELYVRFHLRRPDMSLGANLLDARDNLLNHLRRPVPEPLDSLYLRAPEVHG